MILAAVVWLLPDRADSRACARVQFRPWQERQFGLPEYRQRPVRGLRRDGRHGYVHRQPKRQHPTDLAMLKGARLVTASETEEGRAWAESRIKQMTGGDPITARFMPPNFFTFQPQFKLTIVGNHKPAIATSTMRCGGGSISFPLR
jgi:hypothetical protein